MAYLSNKTINYLNLHLALVGLLDQSYLVFGPVYLYQQGFSVAQVLVLLMVLSVLRMPLRLLAFPVIHRFGLKGAVMIGAAGYGLSFPVLGHVHGVDRWLVLYLVLYSFCNAMHWLALHTFYSVAGEPEKRGRQVAVAQALGAGVAALSPVLSALFISATSFQSYFMLAVILIVLMLLALSRCENIFLPPVHWRDGRKVAMNLGVRIQMTEAATVYLMNVCWLFVVYLYVGKIESLGGIVTFGVVVQVAYQLVLGSWVDKGRGASIITLASGLRMFVAIGRALLTLSLPVILVLETVAAGANVHTNAIEPTVAYNSGKESAHPLWFWLFAETAWDIGTLIGAGGGAFLLWQGVALRHVILMALPFIGILWWGIHNYCIKNPYVRPTV